MDHLKSLVSGDPCFMGLRDFPWLQGQVAPQLAPATTAVPQEPVLFGGDARVEKDFVQILVQSIYKTSPETVFLICKM